MSFTHLNKDGEAVMVDVGGKAVTERTAIASATVAMKEDTLKGIIDISLKKGDVLAVLTTGAYNFSMSSNYNRLLRPAVVMVKNSVAREVVRRETVEDLLKNDL